MSMPGERVENVVPICPFRRQCQQVSEQSVHLLRCGSLEGVEPFPKVVEPGLHVRGKRGLVLFLRVELSLGFEVCFGWLRGGVVPAGREDLAFAALDFGLEGENRLMYEGLVLGQTAFLVLRATAER